MPEKPALNEATVKALSIPEKGNRVYYFAGDVLQGIRAPQGFGVRVTAAGIRSFVLNYRLRGREYRYTIGQYPTWSALRAVREARPVGTRGLGPVASTDEQSLVIAIVRDQFDLSGADDFDRLVCRDKAAKACRSVRDVKRSSAGREAHCRCA
jgi:hypothetical protein